MRALLVAAALALAGCVAPTVDYDSDRQAPPPADWGEPALAGTECGRCYEPTVAWLPSGRLVAASANGDVFAYSDDGGRTFAPLEAPPVPEGSRAEFRGDVLVQVDPAGRLWWSALLPEDIGAMSVQVARSDDGGATWAVNHRLTFPVEPVTETDFSDRQWLAFDGVDTVYVACTCPALAVVQVARSDDGGETFAEPQPLTVAHGRAGPVGPPVVPAPDRVVIPYLTGLAGGPGGDLRSAGVRVAVSTDGGASYEERVVHVATAEGGTRCCGFPSAAAGPDGSVHVAWAGADGGVYVATSEDGGDSWSAPARWNAADDVAVWPHPWVAADGSGALVVAWFSHLDGGGVAATVARGMPQDVAAGAVPEARALGDAATPNTDFAHVALAADGRAAVTWEADGVWVAAESTVTPA